MGLHCTICLWAVLDEWLGLKKQKKGPYRICLLNPRRTLWLALQATYAPWPTKPLEDTCVCPKYCMVQHFHLLRGKSQLYLAWSRCTSESVRLFALKVFMLCFILMPRSFNIAHRLSDSNMTLKAEAKHSSKKCMILHVEMFYSVLF